MVITPRRQFHLFIYLYDMQSMCQPTLVTNSLIVILIIVALRIMQRLRQNVLSKFRRSAVSVEQAARR